MDAIFPWDSISLLLTSLEPRDILDITIVTLAIYAGFISIRGTRAVQVLRGFVVLALIVYTLSLIIELPAFSWLVSNILPVLFLAIPVIFQPELRRTFEQIGRTGNLTRIFRKNKISPLIIAVKDACLRLSQRRHGALIILK